MRIGLLDCSAVSETEPTGAVRFPSPSLLRAIPNDATVRYLEPATLGSATDLDAVIAAVPTWCATAAADVLRLARVPVQIVDPWSTGTRGDAAYAAVPRGCHGEVDLAPHRWPVHPWVAATAGNGDPDRRVRAAIDGLAVLPNARLIFGDERVRLDRDRLRDLALAVTDSLRTQKRLVELALRVWPEDLAVDGMITNLSLLPVIGLDLLLGSLHDPSLAAMNAPLTSEQLVRLVAAIDEAGLGPQTSISIVVGLPGESVDDAIAVLNKTLQLAVAHRVAAVRCALWLGGTPPRDREDQRTKFLASHTWTEEEYRGFHDLVALVRKVTTATRVIGPGFLSHWDTVP